MRFPVVLFDLDGTLIDSRAMILASLRHATRTVLAREFADEELLAAVGGSGLREQMHALDPMRTDALVQCYRDHNEPLHAKLRPCPGVERVLERFREEGRRLGIVTSKRRATVRLAEPAIPLTRYFHTFVTLEDTDRSKPDPQPVLLALERLGAEPTQAAYVGDSPFDVMAAKAAGAYALGVTWGRIHPPGRLRAAGADAVVDDPEELVGAL